MERSQTSFRVSTSRTAAIAAAFFFAAFAFAAHEPATTARRNGPSLGARSRVMENFGRLPLSFEPNRGQADAKVDFLSRGRGFEALLDRRGATLVLATTKAKSSAAHPIRMNVEGASIGAHPEAQDRLPGVVNYYRGNNPAKWHRGVPTYSRVKYDAVYPGIDLAYHGDGGKFEFDFVLKPGADAHRIALGFDGISRAEVAADGSALLKTAQGDLTLKRPLAYQEIAGTRHQIDAGYKVSDKRITIALGDYDHSRPLTIDPVLLFSTLFGGTTTVINGAAIDSSGNVYVTGYAFDCTGCVEFPTSAGSQTYAGGSDAFISKISSDGSTLEYSTLIGGSNFDEGKGVAVDGSGNAYLAGETFSTDFPRTVGPASAPGNGDGFVAEFGTTGAVTWATYLGGSGFDEAFSIAVPPGCASNCNAYVAGQTQSSSFPGASGFTGADDAFVTEMTADGTGEVYTTLIAGNIGATGAGSAITFATSIAVDSGGVSFVAGGTDATDFPKTEGASLTGATDAFAAKLNSSGTVAYARLLGGSDYDQAEGIAIQPNCSEPCNAYVEGITFSADFPTHAGLGTSLTSTAAEFIAELSPDGSSTVYSTLLGTSDAPLFAAVNGIAVDTAGDTYLIGSTTSASFALHNQVGTFPGTNGAVFQFEEGSPGPTPTPAPNQLTWPSTNGSALNIQQGNSGNQVVIGTTTGLFVSTDGTTFTHATATGLPSGAVPAVQYETSLTPNVIFAGTGSGLYVSTNMGATFSSTGLTKSVEFVVDIAGSSLSNTDILAGTVSNGAWSSTDGGTTFTQVASLPRTATIFSLATSAKDGGQVFAGTSRGVYTSANVTTSFPGTWSATNLTMSAVGSVTGDRNSTPPVIYAGTFFQGLYESTDNFNTFIRANIPQFSYSAVELDRDNGTTPSTIFAGVNALEQAYVYQNPSGYGGAFFPTNFANQPGSVKGMKNPYVGELLQFHPVIAELNPNGTSVTFSSYLAGTRYDSPGGIAVDPTGTNIYLAGTTYSSDFPTQGPQQTSYDGFANGFIAKIGPPAGATATTTGTPSPTPTGTPTMVATPTPTPIPGKIAAAPSKLNLKPVGIGVGASSTAKLTIKNVSKTGELVGNVSIANNQPGTAFILSPGGMFDIAPHGTPLIETVTFTPDATLDTAMITIMSNDPSKPTIPISVTGKGLAGKLSVAKTLVIKSPGVNMQGSANLILKNVGKGILMGTSMPPTPNSIFMEAGGGGGGGNSGILPGKTKPIQIIFTPAQTGTTLGSIEIDVQSPSTPAKATVTLKGIAK